MNLIEIGLVVIEIRGAEKLAVPVNNTLVRHTAFSAADTRPCVLMYVYIYVMYACVCVRVCVCVCVCMHACI